MHIHPPALLRGWRAFVAEVGIIVIGVLIALGHGCIRTQHIVDLATELLSDNNGAWSSQRVQATLDSKKSVQASFVKPLPVYIVYFSAAALNDGKIVDYRDLYNRDAKALAALNARDGGAAMAKPKVDKIAAK